MVIEYVDDEFSRAIKPKIVEKCGTRDYWEDWAVNVAEIVQKHITRLNSILKDRDTKVRRAFDGFLAELQDDLNDKITETEAIEMLAQHIVTRPIFAVLFEGYRFTSRNSVSRAMQSVLDIIDKVGIDKESRDLGNFYRSVERRAKGITAPQAKQALIKELYDKFFRGAFPRTTKRLGITYTPIEIVDFIIHSVNDVLQEEFGETLDARDVHIIDPFTGTGTFITRLLQSGLIGPEEIEYKFRKEIHANEIVLLAYYIAAINIETVYHSLMGGDYVPFEGICLTDTFQMYESDDLLSYYMPDNSARRKRQKKQDIRVIIGNPPYSVGQKKQDDDAKNVRYSTLDNRIKETYMEHSSATGKRNLYDSYIRAIRWASDRIGESGVVGFITNNGWIEKGFADGLRKCLAEEFTSLYVINLRGDVRKNMLSQSRAGEGEGIFGSSSMTGATIALFVKNPTVSEHGQIFYHDIGDNLKREDKLSCIANFRSITGIREANGWTRITPNRHGDWINPRIEDFEKFLRLGYKEKELLSESVLFAVYSLGVVTNRDAWCCNYSQTQLTKNIARTIAFYNTEVERFQAAKQENMPEPAIHRNPKEMSWTHHLEKDLKSRKPLSLRDGVTMLSLYRPFTKQWLYYSRRLNESVFQMPQIFPEPGLENQVIVVSGVGARTGFSCLMADCIPNLDFIQLGQCFPLWRYTPVENDKSKLGLGSQESEREEVMATSGRRYLRTSALTVQGMNRVRKVYTGMDITEEDVFFYVYGLLHSEEYRTRFVHNLFKELARIPLMRTREGFETFREAGKALAYLHTNYESIEPYPVRIAQGDLLLNVIEDPAAFYRVTKMKFGGGQGDKQDKSTVTYNHNITMLDIPLAAYEYIVNGKSAVEWVMTRQGVSTDKDSGIVKDANCYAIETVGDPSYPFSLFCRIIRVSLETMKIVRGLPDLDLVFPETK